MTLSGSGNNTNPRDIMWFCHLCGWAGLLPVGVQHVCKPAPPDPEEER